MPEIEEGKQITIIDGEGKEHLMEILFTYENEERGTKYVFFFDPAEPENVIPMRYKDDGTLKNCPECGKVLIARKAGFGLEFYIEKCGHCSGIWLDNNEWNFLKESNLENNIYYIFSSSWQNYVHKQEVREIKINNIKKYFSDEQSEKIIDFLDWLDNQENKREIQSYIISN